MAMQYYLTSGKNKVGPMTEDQIVNGVRSGKFNLFDMILNSQTNEWVMLMQHPDFSDLEATPSEAIAEAPAKEITHSTVGLLSDAIEQENAQDLSFVSSDSISVLATVYWYEKNNLHKRLKFLDVLSLIQNKKLSEHSLLSRSPYDPWKRLVDWDDFSAESLANYKQTTQVNLPDINIRRKFERFECGKVFVIIANNKAYQVFCPDISKTGFAFIVRSPKANLQDNLLIKFSDTLSGSKFDAKGIVVSARKVRLPGSDNVYVRYGVSFTHLAQSGRDFLDDISANNEKAAA